MDTLVVAGQGAFPGGVIADGGDFVAVENLAQLSGANGHQRIGKNGHDAHVVGLGGQRGRPRKQIIAGQHPFSRIPWRLISFGEWLKTFSVT